MCFVIRINIKATVLLKITWKYNYICLWVIQVLSRSTNHSYIFRHSSLTARRSAWSIKERWIRFAKSKIRVPEKIVNKSNRKCVWHAVRLPSFSRNWLQRLYHRSRQSRACSALFSWFDSQIVSHEHRCIDASLLFADCTSAKIHWR